MDGRDTFDLPVHGQAADQDPGEQAPSCSPKVYVSNEEAAVVRKMLELKQRAEDLRLQLDAATEESDRDALASELEKLRVQWSDLSQRREAAYRRKMVMLGHLPPESLID